MPHRDLARIKAKDLSRFKSRATVHRVPADAICNRSAI